MFRVMLLSFDPRSWLRFTRNIRVSGDATPSMLPLALIGTLAFSSGLLSQIPYAYQILVFTLAPMLLISIVGAALAMLDSLRDAFSEGFRGFTRSQRWFELARASLIAGILLAITSVVCVYFGLSVVEFTGILAATAFGIFLTGSAGGSLLAKTGESKPSGAAYDCVDFFLPLFLAGIAVVIPVVLLKNFVGPMYVIATTVVLAVLSVVVLKVIERFGASYQNAE